MLLLRSMALATHSFNGVHKTAIECDCCCCCCCIRRITMETLANVTLPNCTHNMPKDVLQQQKNIKSIKCLCIYVKLNYTMTSHIFMFSFNICLSAMRRFVLFVTDDQYTIISVQRTIHLHCVISSVGKKGDKANKKFNRILSNLMASSQIWRESHYFSNGIKKLL